MKASILFSGGKDSCLVAIILSKFFDIELVTTSFGVLDNWKQAKNIAKKLGFPFKVLKLDKKILEKALDQVIKDGFPNNGIKYIHHEALKELAMDSSIIADGVRRDDLVPVLSASEIRQMEDKYNIHFIQPLAGYSRKTVDLLVDQFFIIEEYKSSSDFIGAEYEFELKEMIKQKYSAEKNKEIFPANHTHSIVLEVKQDKL